MDWLFWLAVVAGVLIFAYLLNDREKDAKMEAALEARSEVLSGLVINALHPETVQDVVALLTKEGGLGLDILSPEALAKIAGVSKTKS